MPVLLTRFVHPGIDAAEREISAHDLIALCGSRAAGTGQASNALEPVNAQPSSPGPSCLLSRAFTNGEARLLARAA